MGGLAKRHRASRTKSRAVPGSAGRKSPVPVFDDGPPAYEGQDTDAFWQNVPRPEGLRHVMHSRRCMSRVVPAADLPPSSRNHLVFSGHPPYGAPPPPPSPPKKWIQKSCGVSGGRAPAYAPHPSMHPQTHGPCSHRDLPPTPSVAPSYRLNNYTRGPSSGPALGRRTRRPKKEDFTCSGPVGTTEQARTSQPLPAAEDRPVLHPRSRRMLRHVPLRSSESGSVRGRSDCDARPGKFKRGYRNRNAELFVDKVRQVDLGGANHVPPPAQEHAAEFQIKLRVAGTSRLYTMLPPLRHVGARARPRPTESLQ